MVIKRVSSDLKDFRKEGIEAPQEEYKDLVKDKSFFSEQIGHPHMKSPRQELYELILSQIPISLWKLSKVSSLSYTFIKRAIRDFEFCRLIRTRTIINLKGRKEKIIYNYLEGSK